MDQDHALAGQLQKLSDFLHNDVPMMQYSLEVQLVDAAASGTTAGVATDQCAFLDPECIKELRDLFEDIPGSHPLIAFDSRVKEHRVAFQFGDGQWMFRLGDHGFQQVGDDGLGMQETRGV